MNYKTKEKVNLTVGYIGMIIVVNMDISSFFFLLLMLIKLLQNIPIF